MSKELDWNTHLIELLTRDLVPARSHIVIKKMPVLKDVFVEIKSGEPGLVRLGFAAQDIVVCDDRETLDISEIGPLRCLATYQNSRENFDHLYVPRLICELKYMSVNTHSLITYSNIAEQIKSVFPGCKYVLALRYRSDSSQTKLLRNGRGFDEILWFDDDEDSREGKKYKRSLFVPRRNGTRRLDEQYSYLCKLIKLALR